jgi:hypothetical protein
MESPATQNTADRQDTDMRKIRTGPLAELAASESMVTGAAQLLPSKVTMLPLAPSTAAQKLGDEHDTDAMPVWVLGTGSLTLGADFHALPLNRKADESRASTAMQKLTLGHDTESGSPADEDSLVGWLHLVPS